MLLIGCKNGKDKPNVSDIKVDVRIERFEQAVFKIDTNKKHKATRLRNNARDYPNFLVNKFEE